MTDFEKCRSIWRQKLAALSILWMCNNVLPLAFDKRFADAYSGTRNPEDLLVEFERHLQHLGLPVRSKIRRLLANRIQSLAAGRKPTHTLLERLRELQESFERSLAIIPSSLEKARGSLAAVVDIGDPETDQELDAMCLLKEQVTPPDTTRIVTAWKEQLRRHLEVHKRPIPVFNLDDESEGDSSAKKEQKLFLPPPPSYIFWTSRDFMETLDAISRYRFMHAFNIGEFSETEADIEGLFASALIESDPGMIASIVGDTRWGEVLFDLWLASRSIKLCTRIRDFIEIALTRVANHQSIEGWWSTAATRYDRHLPDIYRTALVCVVLLRLSRNNWQVERAVQGVKWLMTQQESTGAWPGTEVQYEEADIEQPENKPSIVANLVRKPDLLTTLLSAEAIRLSGLDGCDHTISAAESWIMSQQSPDGTWSNDGFPFPFMTVLVIEYFERRRPPLVKLGNYFSIARGFLIYSQELVVEDNENSRRLAILAAFQGIEAFLYACLSHPSINISFFDKPDATIGMRKALTRLQTHFQTAKILNPGQVIEHKNELDRLAYHRDQIVHKGTSIGEKDARELIEASTQFGDLISQRVFGYPLL